MMMNTPTAGHAPAALPPVPMWHRWRCPLCGASYRHPWHLSAHLARPADRLGHGMDDADAWAAAAAVEPVDTTPGLTRHPARPPIPMAPPAATAAG